jgi:competence protein ComEA
LEALPNVGPNLAKKIVEHRERFGRFRKPEHLLMIEGVSDKRFREIRHLVKVE